jgi:AcrR family transcriptional regulator
MRDGQKRTALRKQKEQALRREAILHAAREVFFQKGFMSATMDGIAHGCDLAKGTLYRYFRSKEELYVSIMAEGLDLLKKDFAGIEDLPLSCDRLLEEILQVYYAFYERQPKYFRIMFLSSQPDVRERAPDELLKECIDSAKQCMQVLSSVIEKGIEEGVYRKVIPWTSANILWSTVNGIIMHYEQGALYREEILKLPLREMLQEALNLALNGLRRSSLHPRFPGDPSTGSSEPAP